jgi:hypothetical protein
MVFLFCYRLLSDSHNLDVFGITVRPPEADAPLIVDSNTQLSGTLSPQQFEPITGRVSEVVNRCRGVQLPPLTQVADLAHSSNPTL